VNGCLRAGPPLHFPEVLPTPPLTCSKICPVWAPIACFPHFCRQVLEKCSHFSAELKDLPTGAKQAGTATFCPMEMRAGILQVTRGVWEGENSGVLDPAWTGQDLSGCTGIYRDLGSDRPVSGSDCLFFWFLQAGFREMQPHFGVFFGVFRRELAGRNSHVLFEEKAGGWVYGCGRGWVGNERGVLKGSIQSDVFNKIACCVHFQYILGKKMPVLSPDGIKPER